MPLQRSVKWYALAICACTPAFGCSDGDTPSTESAPADAAAESSTDAELPPPDAPETPKPTQEKLWGFDIGSDCAALDLVVGADNIFVQTLCSQYGLDKYEVIAVPKNGSAHSVFLSGDNRFDALEYHGGEVFYETWCTEEGGWQYYRCLVARSEATGQERELTDLQIMFTDGLVVSDDRILAVHQLDLDGTHEVVSLPRAGGDFEPVVTEPTSIDLLALDGSTMYWVAPCGGTDQQLKSMSVYGGSPQVVVDLVPGCGGTLCGDAYCASEGSQLMARFFDGSVSVLAEDADAFRMAFDGTFLYWTEYESDEAWRVDLTGGQPVAVYDSYDEVVDIAATSPTDVFVLTSSDLYRVQPAAL